METAPQIRYGKRIVITSFSNGQPAAEKEMAEESISVNGLMDAMSQIGIALKNIQLSDNHKITFEVIGDHGTFEPVRIVTKYQVRSKKL